MGIRVVSILSILLIAGSMGLFAHPGRTASDGCHYCRTNCDSWGVPSGQRHCHAIGYKEKHDHRAEVVEPELRNKYLADKTTAFEVAVDLRGE